MHASQRSCGERELLERSREVGRADGTPWQRSSTARALARALLARGDPERAAALVRESLDLTQGLEEPQGTADGLELLGAVEAARGDPRSGAALFGAAAALRDSIVAVHHPDVRRWHERVVASLRDELGVAGYDAAHERGRALSVEEAVAVGV